MFSRLLVPVFAAFALSSSAPAHAAWGDHLATGAQWLADITPAHNVYASPSEVAYVGGTLTVNAVCGGFASELMKASYPDLTDDVMSALMDDDPDDEHNWNSPDSEHWYNAIVDEVSTTSDGLSFGLEHITHIDDVEEGDLLVSVYTSAGTSGHTMVIYDMPTTYSLVYTSIPGYGSTTKVERYRVTVLDSTSSVHLNRSDSTDSRYMKDVDPNDATKKVNDEGMGTGELYIYADHATGALVGWTWNVVQGTAYQATDSTATNYRPFAVGRLTGTGL